MKKIILALSLFSSIALADHPIQVGKPVVAVAMSAMAQGIPVIDVRQEACEGYVKGAHLISVDEFLSSPDAAVAKVLKLVGNDKTKDIVVYCRSGARSAKAIAVLQKFGFTKLHNIGGLGDFYEAETMDRCQN